MTACCGLDCAACDAFLATQADDDARRAAVAKDWSSRYGVEVKPEHINCDGCRADGRKVHYCANLCEIRKCCLARNLDNCSLCSDYPCQIIKSFFQIAPEMRATLDALRSARKP